MTTTKPKHRCAEFQRIRHGFQQDIGRAERSAVEAAPRWRDRAQLQSASLKRRMARKLNDHLAGCRECDR